MYSAPDTKCLTFNLITQIWKNGSFIVFTCWLCNFPAGYDYHQLLWMLLCATLNINNTSQTKRTDARMSYLRGSSQWSWCSGRVCRWRWAHGGLSLVVDNGTRPPERAWPWSSAAGRRCPGQRPSTAAATPELGSSWCRGSAPPSLRPLRRTQMSNTLMFDTLTSPVQCHQAFLLNGNFRIKFLSFHWIYYAIDFYFGILPW